MSTTTTALAAGTYTIDASHSTIGFVARHAMVTKVRGSFTDFEGAAVVGDDLSRSTAQVTIQAASITTNNEQRDGHLLSNDFLDVEGFPTITFTATKVEPQGDVLRTTGDLTIKGTTQPITIDFEITGSATDPFGNERVGFEGSVVINRKDYGVTWNAALEAGGVLVSDKITLEFDISAIKSA